MVIDRWRSKHYGGHHAHETAHWVRKDRLGQMFLWFWRSIKRRVTMNSVSQWQRIYGSNQPAPMWTSDPPAFKRVALWLHLRNLAACQTILYVEMSNLRSLLAVYCLLDRTSGFLTNGLPFQYFVLQFGFGSAFPKTAVWNRTTVSVRFRFCHLLFRLHKHRNNLTEINIDIWNKVEKLSTRTEQVQQIIEVLCNVMSFAKSPSPFIHSYLASVCTDWVLKTELKCGRGKHRG
jgi:hypothetical protein